MDPVFFSIGNLTIRWYGFMAALGFLAACGIMQWNRRYAKLSGDQVTNIVMLAMISGILGARIFYVAQNWSFYRNHLNAIIRIDQGGLVFYGGFILATLTLIVYLRRIKCADYIRVLDIVAPALAAAHALGRVGCFLNGCCYGKPAQICWAVVYDAGSEPFRRYGSQPLHPVQIYEALLNIILAIGLFFLVRKAKRGLAMSVYILAYGILRFVDEFFRGDHSDFVSGFTPAQVIGFAMIPLGIFLSVKFLRQTSRNLPEGTSGNEA